MTSNEQQEHFKTLAAKLQNIMLKKGDDYAGADRLSNFKFTSQVVRIQPEQTVLTEIVKKCTRIGNLLASPDSPKNEPIIDSIEDLVNYCVLLHMVHIEQKQLKQQ